MTDLIRGGNTALATDRIEIAVSGASPGTVDLLVFQVGDSGRVRSDADMVFYNQPASPEGAVRLLGPDRIAVDLTAVPVDVSSLVVSVALDEGAAGSLANVAGLGVTVTDGHDVHRAFASDLSAERAAVLAEIYRRGPGWKLRNVSAGWNAGLAALAREHGVTIEDEPAPTPPPPPAPAPAAPLAPAAPAAPLAPAAPPASASVPQASSGPRAVPGEAALSLEKRQVLDLRKQQVHRVLLAKNATGIRARILLVLDKTGSMTSEYRTGVVRRVVERMVPVATQLDDDGTIECYLYADSFLALPDLRVEHLDAWLDEFVHLRGVHGGLDYDRIGFVNSEIPIMTEIVSQLRAGDPVPTLVLFFTDGGFSNRRPIIKLITEAAHLPAFWQFVGIGKRGSFGVLEKLDDMGGRVIDNVDFFPVQEIDRMSDDELYRLLLTEFPDWLSGARSLGIVG